MNINEETMLDDLRKIAIHTHTIIIKPLHQINKDGSSSAVAIELRQTITEKYGDSTQYDYLTVNVTAGTLAEALARSAARLRD